MTTREKIKIELDKINFLKNFYEIIKIDEINKNYEFSKICLEERVKALEDIVKIIIDKEKKNEAIYKY